MPSEPDFPQLYHGRPDWPSTDDYHLFWIGLHTKFVFAHHPAEGGSGDPDSQESAPSSFCRPRHLCEKLVGLILKSKGGSILVTGYRGTGKSSMVNLAIDEIRKEYGRQAEMDADLIEARGRLKEYNTTFEKVEQELKSSEEALEGAVNKLREQKLKAERVKNDVRTKAKNSPDWAALQRDCNEKQDSVRRAQAEKAHAAEKVAAAKAAIAKRMQGKRVDYLLRVDVNLSTVTSAHEVLILTYEALQRRLIQYWDARVAEGSFLEGGANLNRIEKIRHDLDAQYRDLRMFSATEMPAQTQGLKLGHQRYQESGAQPTHYTFNREALSCHQALLVDLIRELRSIPHLVKNHPMERVLHPVFVFDELDKLLPVDSERARGGEGTAADDTPQARKLQQLQRIVAELKFFFSQSDSHQILIAGKDVDDSWSEDQNRGSGLFESIFVANLHVPSIFSCEFEPCTFGLGQHIAEHAKRNKKNEIEQLDRYYATLAREIGIARNSWSYNTALLILPYLAEYETFQLLTRAMNRGSDDTREISAWRRIAWRNIRYAPHGVADRIEKGCLKTWRRLRAWGAKGPMSERSCRRLNTLILYLTYKGRGIPRKILREFYDTVSPRQATPASDPGRDKLGAEAEHGTVRYLIAFPQHHLQKMNFYATIVATLNLSYPELRGLNDKGRVAIFHVLDYILKFYATGFSLRDLEHANFMTTREEFYPSRQLATLILRLLDGRLWRRKDPRSPEYRLLHNVVHDLGVMFLRYGPEQSELRHTQTDFREEIERLQRLLKGVQETPPDQRTAPVHAQIRLARIFEMTGNHHEARLGYYKALRWLRADIATLEKSMQGMKTPPLRAGFTRSFLMVPTTYAIEVLLAVGRLHEETGEYPSAIQHYLEAEQFYHNLQIHTRRPKKMPHFEEEPQNRKLVAALDNLPKWLDSEELLQTLIPFGHPKYEQAKNELSTALCSKVPVTDLDLRGEVSGLGAGLHGIAAGRIEALNHTAIAYAKLWENVSANLQFLAALTHLRELGDEYGVVDQMFLIGQIMVRKRDFRAAALWYLAALRNIRVLHEHGDAVAAQTGAQWQTHAAATGTEAQILAALGDVWFATDGTAMLSLAEIRECQGTKGRFPALEVNRRLHDAAREATGRIVTELRTYASEDRAEEYFHTQARYLFQSIGDTFNASDVYLRQLEARAEIIRHSASLLDHAAAPSDRRTGAGKRKKAKVSDEEKYRFLNAWRYFWRGAGTLLYRHLAVAPEIARNTKSEWGRVNASRRMGNLLRLIGTVLTEIALHVPEGNARRLLTAQARQNQRELKFPASISKFYKQFIAHGVNRRSQEHRSFRSLKINDVKRIIRERQRMMDPKDRLPKQTSTQALDILLRVGVLSAANDIERIFNYLRNNPGRKILSAEGEALDQDLVDINSFSPLYRISGQNSGLTASDPSRTIDLPLAAFYRKIFSEKAPVKASPLRQNLRLLLLAEQAHVSSFINYRDSIPDYGFAASALATGELYMVALHLTGLAGVKLYKKTAGAPKDPKTYRDGFLAITNIAKRYIVKAIDILKRERDQNRNTFHLMSEAHFNLGDLLLLRLAALPEDPSEPEIPKKGKGKNKSLCTRLFGFDILKPEDKQLLPDGRDPFDGDRYPEDLRRQIWEHYREGILLVQSEMEELFGRYRFPPDVFHAHRNVMDPVLHHRICKATRMRHVATRPYNHSTRNPKDPRPTGYDAKKYDQYWDALCQQVTYTAPPSLHNHYWLEELAPLLEIVNKVRSDRGPLRIHLDVNDQNKPRWVEWAQTKTLETQKQIVLFFESYLSREIEHPKYPPPDQVGSTG